MQYINHWPEKNELALPEVVTEEIYRQLITPFNDEVSAKAFWEETSTSIIILEPSDCIQQLKKDEQIQFALAYPEYSISLKIGYQLMLAILNDSGAGVFVVVPPKLSHIIPR